MSPTFTRELGKLTAEERATVEQTLSRFIARTHENALLPEKKSGLQGIWAIRVSGGDRLFYVQEKSNDGQTVSVFFHYGPHDDYRTILRAKP